MHATGRYDSSVCQLPLGSVAREEQRDIFCSRCTRKRVPANLNLAAERSEHQRTAGVDGRHGTGPP
jgi:hypothetical protein